VSSAHGAPGSEVDVVEVLLLVVDVDVVVEVEVVVDDVVELDVELLEVVLVLVAGVVLVVTGRGKQPHSPPSKGSWHASAGSGHAPPQTTGPPSPPSFRHGKGVQAHVPSSVAAHVSPARGQSPPHTPASSASQVEASG
jgi:hypothetical protein